MRALFLLLAMLASPALACGPDTDCEIENGLYRVHLPPEAPQGAILFAHGYRGTAAGTIRNGALTRLADDLGVALVALKSFDEDWTIPNAPSAGQRPERDEVAYVRRVKDDVAERFGIDPERMLMAGFSAGGMLTWNVACEAGDGFAAFVPMSGTFWKGPPDHCPTDARIYHFHGTADTVVPIEGRPIGPTVQGDMNAVLAMYRADKGLETRSAPAFQGLDCIRREGAAAMLQYCLHPGGHQFRADWIRGVWDEVFAGR